MAIVATREAFPAGSVSGMHRASAITTNIVKAEASPTYTPEKIEIPCAFTAPISPPTSSEAYMGGGVKCDDGALYNEDTSLPCMVNPMIVDGGDENDPYPTTNIYISLDLEPLPVVCHQPAAKPKGSKKPAKKTARKQRQKRATLADVESRRLVLEENNVLLKSRVTLLESEVKRLLKTLLNQTNGNFIGGPL